jgi:hypothetical protein
MFVKILLLAGTALLIWSAAARPSGAHGHKVTYLVKPYDTLWSIASSHYSGDPRAAIWQIENANHLGSAGIHPGELIVLP